MTLLDSDGKAAVIRDTADSFPGIQSFVETGSATGELPWLIHHKFDRVVTIEQDADLYESAMNRLLPYPKVRVIHGDSGALLGPVLAALDELCVIWLDAHSLVRGGPSALTDEMHAIACDARKHVILIDDARLCNGRKGWMKLSEIEGWCRGRGYEHRGVEDDIVRIVP